MPGRSKSYEQFGPFLLFKKLESDALGDLWRAASIEGGTLGPTVALRRWTGGNREALAGSAEIARQVAPLLTGPSFVRGQTAGVVGGTPYLSWEYAGGRSLRHIVERARGGAGATANPIPLDQAIVIAERVALSLATTVELRAGGARLSHGALIPQLVWITDDGETRVAGQQFGKGLIASFADERVAAETRRYFSTEYAHSGEATRASEVYSLGAILYYVVTGHEPPDPTRASAFVQTVRGAKTMGGAPLPDDIRQILEKSLNLDPAARYPAVADMRLALSAVSGRGATSFNLAFYLSTLLKKEMESEVLDRERESKTNVLPYLQSPDAPAPVPLREEAPRGPAKRRALAAIAAAAALLAVGAGTWVALGSKKTDRAAPPLTLAGTLAPVVKQQPVVPEPIVASMPSQPAASPVAPTATQAEIDASARRKAFDDAVQKKLNAELMKLQANYNRQIQRQQARNAPVESRAAAVVPQPVTTTIAEEPVPAPTAGIAQPQPAVAVSTETAPLVQAPQPPPVQPVVATVRQGDLIDISELDAPPRRIRDPRVTYPPIAARQKIETTVMATVLVSETGDVLDVKILRGDPRFGFNDAAIRALKEARFTIPMKAGQRVRTWTPQIVQFKP